MRNPLTACLAAMGLHAVASLALGWPYPSVATFLAGLLAVVAALLAPSAPPRASAGIAALVVLAPTVVPPAVLAAGLAAGATAFLPSARDPLRNGLVSLPALTVVVLAMTV